MGSKMEFKRTGLLLFVLIILILTAFCVWNLKSNFVSSHKNLRIILISIDALRPDHLGCYGYKKNTSPNIDKFAKEGILFTQAIAQGSRTYPSLPSLFTSTYPRTHGVYNRGYKINPSLTTLTEILKKNGYSTAAIISSNITQVQGLERGFDFVFDNGDIGAAQITEQAYSWLKENRYNKFFIWIHYFDPHGPYRPPEHYNRMFVDGSKGKDLPINRDSISGFMGIPGYVAENNITDASYYISQYDGEIRFVDEQIAVLLKKIRELNLDKNTIFIITADHGEAMGERNHYFEHWSIYDEIIKVPLIIKCEEIIPQAKIIHHQVQSIDIVPTILDCVGIAKPKSMRGESLIPLILKNKKHKSISAFSELSQSDDTAGECIRTNEWKLMYRRFTKRDLGEVYELYNLRLDPQETNNVASTEINKFGFLNKRLNKWRKENPLSKPLIADNTTAKLTEETKKILRSLGYLE